jgi:glycosyltransferase involved in cell wall biosynthesis
LDIPNIPDTNMFERKITAFSIVIPAYNEEAMIARQIESIRAVLTPQMYDFEILVVDDGSTDNTAKNVISTGVRLLQHPENRGYGASLKSGILAAANDVIVIIDADGTYPVDKIPTLVEKLETTDMVVGARVGDNVHIPLIRQPAKLVLRLLAMQIAEQSIPDLNSGLRAFRRECAIQYYSILSNRFSFTTTITLSYIADNYCVEYIPIDYYPRVGKSKIVPRHFMDFLILIVRMSMMFNPLKVFIPLAVTMGLLGVLKTIYDIVAVFLRNPGGGWELLLQPALSTSAVLLLFIGLQLMMIGMMADGVVRRIAQHNRPIARSYGNMNFEISLDKFVADKPQPFQEKM